MWDELAHQILPNVVIAVFSMALLARVPCGESIDKGRQNAVRMLFTSQRWRRRLGSFTSVELRAAALLALGVRSLATRTEKEIQHCLAFDKASRSSDAHHVDSIRIESFCTIIATDRFTVSLESEWICESEPGKVTDSSVYLQRSHERHW